MFLLCLKFKVLKLHFSIEFVLEAEISNLCWIAEIIIPIYFLLLVIYWRNTRGFNYQEQILKDWFKN